MDSTKKEKQLPQNDESLSTYCCNYVINWIISTRNDWIEILLEWWLEVWSVAARGSSWVVDAALETVNLPTLPDWFYSWGQRLGVSSRRAASMAAQFNLRKEDLCRRLPIFKQPTTPFTTSSFTFGSPKSHSCAALFFWNPDKWPQVNSPNRLFKLALNWSNQLGSARVKPFS